MLYVFHIQSRWSKENKVVIRGRGSNISRSFEEWKLVYLPQTLFNLSNVKYRRLRLKTRKRSCCCCSYGYDGCGHCKTVNFRRVVQNKSQWAYYADGRSADNNTLAERYPLVSYVPAAVGASRHERIKCMGLFYTFTGQDPHLMMSTNVSRS